jgi:hypothetical protein
MLPQNAGIIGTSATRCLYWGCQRIPNVLVLVHILLLSHLAACCQQQCCLSKGVADAECVDGAELLHTPHHAVHSNGLVLIAILAVAFL